jgi:pimeloyl-ACP methyl ester carboxylesterase
MNASIHPQYITVDGLSIRFAESATVGPHALLLSPWPESVFAFARVWDELAHHAHLVAVDPPGFGQSQGRAELMNPKAMGEFLIAIADELELENPHVVAPDIGTSSTLFAAAAYPERFRTAVVGSGAAAVPVQVTGVLKDWVESTDVTPFREIGGGVVVDIALGTIAGYTPSSQIREDYLVSYNGDRFADTVPYVQHYREQLPTLAELLPSVQIPVRIVQGSADQVVPQVNAEYLGERLPNSSVDFIDGAGHFCWEEKPDEYAALITDWWSREHTPM